MDDRVTFLGPQPQEAVLSLMQSAEVFALTSETAPGGAAEGLGLVLNEASSCACPIVATSHGGIPEAVRHGETGLLADEGDVEGIATQLDTFLSDRALGVAMGKRGRELVTDKFNMIKQAAKLEDLYDMVLETRET